MYGFNTQLKTPFAETVEKLVASLKDEGFGVLSDIDVKATMKAKLEHDMGEYRILGACNPALARRAIDIDPDIGLLLPCNVVVREEANGDTTVLFMDTEVVLHLVDKPDIKALAEEVKTKLQRVCASLTS